MEKIVKDMKEAKQYLADGYLRVYDDECEGIKLYKPDSDVAEEVTEVVEENGEKVVRKKKK